MNGILQFVFIRSLYLLRARYINLKYQSRTQVSQWAGRSVHNIVIISYVVIWLLILPLWIEGLYQ